MTWQVLNQSLNAMVEKEKSNAFLIVFYFCKDIVYLCIILTSIPRQKKKSNYRVILTEKQNNQQL